MSEFPDDELPDDLDDSEAMAQLHKCDSDECLCDTGEPADQGTSEDSQSTTTQEESEDNRDSAEDFEAAREQAKRRKRPKCTTAECVCDSKATFHQGTCGQSSSSMEPVCTGRGYPRHPEGTSYQGTSSGPSTSNQEKESEDNRDGAEDEEMEVEDGDESQINRIEFDTSVVTLCQGSISSAFSSDSKDDLMSKCTTDGSKMSDHELAEMGVKVATTKKERRECIATAPKRKRFAMEPEPQPSAALPTLEHEESSERTPQVVECGEPEEVTCPIDNTSSRLPDEGGVDEISEHSVMLECMKMCEEVAEEWMENEKKKKKKEEEEKDDETK